MSQIYKRKVGNNIIRLGFYSDKDEYVVFVNNKMYGVANNIKDGYALYNEIK